MLRQALGGVILSVTSGQAAVHTTGSVRPEWRASGPRGDGGPATRRARYRSERIAAAKRVADRSAQWLSEDWGASPA
ncbi:hypothetical protein SLA2020_440900 [Shorea laevis]